MATLDGTKVTPTELVEQIIAQLAAEKAAHEETAEALLISQSCVVSAERLRDEAVSARSAAETALREAAEVLMEVSASSGMGALDIRKRVLAALTILVPDHPLLAHLDARDARGADLSTLLAGITPENTHPEFPYPPAGQENEFDTQLPGPPRPMTGLTPPAGQEGEPHDGERYDVETPPDKWSWDQSRARWKNDCARLRDDLRASEAARVAAERDRERWETEYYAISAAFTDAVNVQRKAEAALAALREVVGEIKANIGSSVVAFKSLHERNPHRGDDAIRSLETAYKALTAALIAQPAQPPDATAPALALVDPLLTLAGFGIPADVQELLIRGNPDRGIRPGALAAACAPSPSVEGLVKALDEIVNHSMFSSKEAIVKHARHALAAYREQTK